MGIVLVECVVGKNEGHLAAGSFPQGGIAKQEWVMRMHDISAKLAQLGRQRGRQRKANGKLAFVKMR